MQIEQWLGNRRSKGSRSHWNLILSMVSLLCLLPGVSLAYELDSHYSLRFALSLTTCFNWDEAHLIASGDWGMDENGSTHAEMNPVQTRNKIKWHVFGHSDKGFLELWLRSVQEPDLELRLVKLGQFMHFLEDWEAHAGYGLRLGHARDTFRGHLPPPGSGVAPSPCGTHQSRPVEGHVGHRALPQCRARRSRAVL